MVFLSVRNMTLAALMIACQACSSTEKQKDTSEADRQAHSRLQGVWLDNTTETPVFQVQGDTVYYPDLFRAASAFEVKGDSFITYGAQTTVYRIERLSNSYLVMHSAVGDEISLVKADEGALEDFFLEESGEEELTAEEPQVVSKDSVVMYDGVRYRGYVYINPTQIKVIRPAVSQEGLSVDNVYYDNIIHICVYKGKQKMFSKDISRSMFSSVIPANFLDVSILEDMDFEGVDDKGYKYRAIVADPEGSACYYVDLLVDWSGNLGFWVR